MSNVTPVTARRHSASSSVRGSTARRIGAFVSCLALAALPSCKDAIGPAPPATVQPLSPTSQTGAVATEVTLQVKVLDARGQPREGVSVAWSPTAGTTAPPSTFTDTAGVASTAWTLPTRVGEYTATAAIADLSPVTFRVAATPGPVAAVAVSPVADTLDPGDVKELTVSAADQYGNAIADAPLSFASTDTTVVTVDANGRIAADWPGSADVTVSSGGHTAAARIRVRELTPSVSAGIQYSCASARNGVLYCWGRSFSGALGTGSLDTEPQPIPRAVHGNRRFASVAAGHGHSCGLTPAGEAYCWGQNQYGELGAATTETCGPTTARYPCSSTPVRVGGGLRFRSIDVNSNAATCGLTTSDEAYCWGHLVSGILGTGASLTPTAAPTPAAEALRFSSLTLGVSHACGITPTGAAYCWGANTSGQLGDASAQPLTIREAVRVSGGHRFREIDAGSLYTCAVTTEDQAYCWGTNAHGQLGNGTTTATSTPQLVAGGHAFASIQTLGPGVSGSTCAVTRAGAAYCWGDNVRGQLGNGTTVGSSVPVPIAGGLSLSSVSPGLRHTCGMATSAQAYCWGDNRGGQLGTGTLIDSAVPAKVLEFGR